MKVQKYLTWVQGNKLTLAIPMQKVTFTVEGKITEDYTPLAGSQIVVELRSQNYVHRYSPELKDGNVLKFSDNGKLEAGTYAVIVEVKEPDGTLRRSQWNNVLTVVASTSLVLDAYEDFPEWAAGAVVDGSVFLFAGSGGGEQVQSNWTETDTGSPAYIQNKPNLATVATSGSYNDLSNKPSIPAAQVNSDWNASSGVAQILNKPTIPAAQIQSDWTQTNTSAKDYIKNKPNLATVATSGSYNDLSNKPTIPSAQIQSDWTQTNTSAKDYIKNKPNLATVATSGSYNDLSNKPSIPADQVNSDWNASSGVAQILNKPDLSVYEVTSNKVTSWQSTPDDTHYPSEKLVYDTIGNIETLLASI